jgi:hypothetical protein
MAENVLSLTTPKPTGAVFMGQVTPTPDLGVGLFSISGVLTNAQLLTLSSAPVDLIPAVAGKIIIPTFVLFRLNYTIGFVGNVSAACRYTGIAIDLTTALQIVNTVVPQSGTIKSADRIQSLSNFASGADLRGLKVVLSGGADTTGGDPANSVAYYLEYRVIDMPS